MKGKVSAFLNKDVKEFNLKLLLLGGFVFICVMGLISYKLTTKSSYALFTNNLNGSKTITLHYEAPKTVTFNPDGGIIPEGTDWTGSGSSATKQVIVGLSYGELPEPVKEGYTFLGWNGKNLINVDDYNVTFTGQYYMDNIPQPKYVFTPSTSYVLSFDHVVRSSSSNVYASVGYGETGYQTDIKSGNPYTGSDRQVLTFTTPATFSYTPANAAFRFVRMSTSGNANVDISKVQLETGSTATEYEPYYITETTKVVQTGNHSLKALWEEVQAP